MAEERESFEGQWASSDVTEENLKEMVAHGVLPAKEIIGWRPAHVSYSHQLPVVPYNAFNPPPQEYALMKSDPPVSQRRSPRQHTAQGGGGPTIRPDPQPQTSKLAGQTGPRKRKLILDDDEGDDDKSGDKGSPNKPPKRTMPRKKLAGRAMPKIRTSSRKPSDIDPSGKDPDPAMTEQDISKDPEPTAENQPTAESQPTGAHASGDRANPSDLPPTGNQSATTETATTQEPPTGNQSDAGPDQEIPEAEAQTTTSQGPEAGNDSIAGSSGKEQRSPHAQLGTSSGPSGDDEEEIPRIKATDDSRPPILIKWWDENSQAAGIVINRQKEDEEVCQLKKALGEATPQAARMEQMAKQIEALERDKTELAAQRDSALKEVEDRKIKSQAQFDVLVGKIKRLEGARDNVANAAAPIIQAMFLNNGGPNGTSEEAALDLISNAQSAADKIASDVVEQFRNSDLQPSDNNSDDERTDSD
ncbi:uncharacterized protein [Oryza sativa Japonica Group]|uniref:uncharacterized protein n=1 Tax=Oryza sativa subsp. japonica TaxID=39947 RepID=UPI00339D1F14